MIRLPPEKLGSFYLGAKYDINAKALGTEPVNYDARDLTTHAVCVGMTGSGKTGLCIGVLEEAALDRVPAIIIDPKGDMTNLLLQFDELRPEDFKNWINPDDAGRKGITVDEYTNATAEKWKKGLASWGQGPNRIKDLKESVDYTIYTPGSDSGIPINIMGSFASPGIDFDSDAELLRERIQGTVAALLGMINSKADPARSREGILLCNLFEHHWRKNEDLDLAGIIKGVQSPPMKQLGVFDVDTFYPPKDRFDLAMDFNSLMASPQFQYWLQGDDLDIEQIYFTKNGKPRHCIFYIAHLTDSERMFFVTLLLNSLITWMRRQSGTTSLRSLLYFDEIFGYFPPTAEPPSKKPLLTILKQARAYGVGAVLVTQNPVDIDYKGLSNAGTWFIGKLQTERDKMRVLDGLEGAIAEAGNTSESDFSKLISSLGSRVFLMHNVHDAQPVVFHTRWAMSYLRGPMTRPQVKELMASKKNIKQKEEKIIEEAPIDPSDSKDVNATPIANIPEPVKSALKVGIPPSLDASIRQRYFAVWKSESEAKQELFTERKLAIVYEPMILNTGRVRFYDSKRDIDEVQNFAYLSEAADDFGRVDWDNVQKIADWDVALHNEPDFPQGFEVKYSPIPDSIDNAKEIKKMEKEFSNWLYETKRFANLEHEKFKLYQEETESNVAFKARVQQHARELRDEELDELQDKYEPKFEKITDKIRAEERDLDEAQAEVTDRKRAEWINVAETVFSVFSRRRTKSLNSVNTKRRMRRKANEKVEESREDLTELHHDYSELKEELDFKLDDIREKWNKAAEGIETREIRPRRTDVMIDGVYLVWHPFWVSNETKERVSART